MKKRFQTIWLIFFRNNDRVEQYILHLYWNRCKLQTLNWIDPPMKYVQETGHLTPKPMSINFH